MMHCLDCNSAIDEHVQHYIVSDMGPEIISVIEQNIGHEAHEVDVNAAICSQCFGNIIRAISADSEISYSNRLSPHPSEEYELQNHYYDTNACIRCLVSLFRRRAHSLPEGPERDFISEEISPREIPHGGLVCYACWVYTQNILQQQRVIIPPVIDLNTCVWCQRSLAITRRHSIPEGPERDEIIRRIHPREIPPGGLVCYACWVSARRNVERERRQNPDPSRHHHRDSICAWCGMSLHRRQTRLLSIVYQIKQVRSYFGEHIRQHGTFQVEVSSELEVVAQAVPSQLDPVLIRGRIKSRHISGRTYYTYILLTREGLSWDERIISYYCTCVSGQRTVGCCAHTMTIIWYLGWARHQDSIAAPASFLDGILVRDDIENEN